MKISIFLLLLLEVHLSKEKQTEWFGQIVLKFDFPLYFNSFSKTCCRLFPGECVIVMDNRGYVHQLLSGRVTRTERSGSIEFRIANAQFMDGGYYRCYVQGTQNVFKDFVVEIYEPLRPVTLPTVSSQPQYRDSSPSAAWTFSMPLATGVSIGTIALIGFVTAIVCCQRKKSQNKVIESQPDSCKPKTAEASSIVYTTVDFKPHPAAKRNTDLPTSPETVEYCTLALRG